MQGEHRTGFQVQSYSGEGGGYSEGRYTSDNKLAHLRRLLAKSSNMINHFPVSTTDTNMRQ